MATCRDEVLAVARTLASRSASGTFTLDQVIREMRGLDTRFKENTIRTHVTSRMCANAPDHHGTVYDDFERVDRGEYRFRTRAAGSSGLETPAQDSNVQASTPAALDLAPPPTIVPAGETIAGGPSGRIGLVGCVKQKLDHAAPAADLYVSPLFRGRRAYVERTCERWFILSALHGVVRPDAPLEPYDVTLNSASRAQRRAWSAKVLRQLDAEVGPCVGLTIEIHAGANYADFGLVGGLRARGATVVQPAAGLSSMGRQLAFYADANHAAASSSESSDTASSHASREAVTSSPSVAPVCQDDEVLAAVADLDEAPILVPACDWPAGITCLDQPGLYSWVIDSRGSDDLSCGLGFEVMPGRIYAGQAGATKWPSGKVGDNTLGKRIGQMHLGGRVRMSTFRWTLASVLFEQLDVQVQASMAIAVSSEEALTEWMRSHLSLAVHAHEDRDTLEDLERQVLEWLDPPFNLRHMQPTPTRARLTELRRQVSREPA